MLEKTLQDRYKIIRPLGSGGFSATFLAIDQQQPDSPYYVIKQLEPQLTDSVHLQLARRLFKTEAKVLQKLGSHPQIPQLLDHFEENQEFYLVQEFIDGHDLSDELISGKQLSESDVICLLQDILGTLAFVHQQNVIHRDIKPSNLIRRHSDYKIVLIDFGAVKQIGTQTVSSSGLPPLTIAIGTPGYLPSEQASGMPKFNSDIYAVGMIGISALTGLSPTRQEFPKDPDTGEICWTHLTDASQRLINILDKMVCYDFRDRYQSVEAVLSDLQKLQLAIEEGESLHLQDSPASAEVTATFEVTTASSQPEDSKNSQVLTEAAEPIKLVHKRQTVKPAIFVGLAVVGVLVGFSSLITFPKIVSKSSFSPSTSSVGSTSTPPTSQAVDLLNKADKLRESQKYTEALAVYNQALQLDPKLKSARWGQCYGLNVMQRYEEALKSCEQALSLDPNYVEALSSRGYAFNALKQYQEALKSYEQALKIKPDYFEAWVNQAATLYNLQRYDEALAAYNKVLEFKPNYPEAWNNKGTALTALKNEQAALEAYDKAIQLKPDYPEAWNNRGVLLETMQRSQDALTSYEKAIQLQPDYSVAKENRQRVLKSLKP
jgi:serine/threonine protein kinase/Tfp pilus assembly protein PilF